MKLLTCGFLVVFIASCKPKDDGFSSIEVVEDSGNVGVSDRGGKWHLEIKSTDDLISITSRTKSGGYTTLYHNKADGDVIKYVIGAGGVSKGFEFEGNSLKEVNGEK